MAATLQKYIGKVLMQVLLFIVMIYHLQELAYVTHHCDSLFNVHVLRIEYYICTYYVQQVLSCNVLREIPTKQPV